MTRPRRFLILGVVALAVVAGGVAWLVTRDAARSPQHEARTTYYCPMHPTYTSNRPGDCPICNMKLVPKEPSTSAASSRQGKALRDICYMHECPMVHQGRPCPMLVVAKEGEKVTCPLCGTHIAEAAAPPKEKKILYWTDPMIPGYKSDKPGKSPMGMELVPVYEEEAGPMAGGPAPEGYAPILVTPKKQQLIGVKTAPAARRAMTKTIRTVGRVMADETRIVHVHPKVEGWIDELYAKYEGDTVTRGQPLFSFFSPDFVSTQQEYLTALRVRDGLPPDVSAEVVALAEANVAAARQRLLWWDVTEEQVQALITRGAPAKTLVLMSPIDGVVLAKHVWAGEYMERGADFYHIADLSSVWVDAAVYEYELPWVAPGHEATVSLPYDPGRQLRGAVVFVSPTLNPETRTATARLRFDNPDRVLRPGMSTTTELTVDLGTRLAVPSEAITETGTRRLLFVDKGQGLFEPRDVVVGVKADGYTEITQGVADGESVVTSGNFLIDSESRLKAALEGAGEPGHQHGP